MALPKLKYPIFELEVPSSKKTHKFRPFLVAEEKILLIAQQSGDLKEIILSLKQVIGNCCQDPEFDSDKLATFDIEYLFLKLRSRSVSSMAKIYLTDNEDGKEYSFDVDLEKVNMVTHSGHNSKIQLNDDIAIVMKYPTTQMIDAISTMQVETKAFFEVMKYCIEFVVEGGDKISVFADAPEAERDEFVQSIDIATFSKITQFFETMPKMHYEIAYKNSLGHDRKAVLRNLNDFFILG
jgi:hypothetical protein